MPSLLPIVTYSLIGLTVFVYLLQILGTVLIGNSVYGIDFVTYWGARISEAIDAGQVWRLITPVFLHGSLMHIFFNMYAPALWERCWNVTLDTGVFFRCIFWGFFGECTFLPFHKRILRRRIHSGLWVDRRRSGLLLPKPRIVRRPCALSDLERGLHHRHQPFPRACAEHRHLGAHRRAAWRGNVRLVRRTKMDGDRSPAGIIPAR